MDTFEGHRKLVKVAILKLINAPRGTRISPPRRSAFPEGLTWNILQDRIMTKHSAIERHFRSGAGIHLQKVDADIAEDVMTAMMEEDRLVLPIHDSFITYEGLGERLLDLMRSSYHRHMNSTIGVDIDLDFLQSEIREENLPTDEEYPGFDDLIGGRLSDPAYAGYKSRCDQFLSISRPGWEERFTFF